MEEVKKIKIKKHNIDKSFASYFIKVGGLIILVLYSFSIIYPLVWGFMTSLKSNIDFSYFSRSLGLPNLERSQKEIFELKNYAEVFKYLVFEKSTSFYAGDTLIVHEKTIDIFGMAFNSILLPGTMAGLQSLLGAIMGYVLAKYPYKSSKVIYLFAVFMMTVPIVGTMPSMLEFLRATRLYDTYIGYFCCKFYFGGVYFLVFFSLFDAMPNSYAEAAEIDGANQYTVLFRIILPLQKNVIGTVFLIFFVQQWNQYQDQMIYMPTFSTLAYAVYHLVNIGKVAELATVPGQLASCMLLSIPVLVLFIFLKDKMMGNVTMGGIKG